MKLSHVVTAAGLVGVLFLSACRTYPDYAGDFRFPIEKGDIAKGQQDFQSLGCVQCHAVEGVDLQRPANPTLTVVLGGELMFAKTYGDLVTSIINPDHIIWRSCATSSSCRRTRVATSTSRRCT